MAVALILIGTPVVVFLVTYLIGSIPFAYIIVKAVTGEDVTEHGSGNVGAMNVRRSTGSWGWFVAAMLADGMKGLVPLAIVKAWILGGTGVVAIPMGAAIGAGYSYPVSASALVIVQSALAGAVLGHNYSLWMALMTRAGRRRGFHRTGKGLATGGGALLAYDWRYFMLALSVALVMIAVTRYMMAGQVSAAASLPVAALVLKSPDLPFAALIAAIVIAAHWRRFIGMLRGREPKLYVNDRMGPRG